jgi:hypothetical protein
MCTVLYCGVLGAHIVEKILKLNGLQKKSETVKPFLQMSGRTISDRGHQAF